MKWSTTPPVNRYKAVQLAELLRGVDGFIAGLDEINETALKAADRLKVISRYGIGIDNVDLEFARKNKIIVTNTPGANSASVAEPDRWSIALPVSANPGGD